MRIFFLLAVHGGSFSRPCWVKALILSSKTSLPCQTGISDWGGSITTLMWTASQRAKRKAGEGGTMARPSHRICADQALNGGIDAGCLALCWEPWWSQRWGPGQTLGTCQQTGADWWRSGRLPSSTPFEDFTLKKCVSKPKGASHLRPVGLILHFFALHQFNFDFIINFLNSFQFCYISQCFRNSFKPLAFGPVGSVCRDTHK